MIFSVNSKNIVKAQAVKSKIQKRNYIKLRSFYKTRKTINKAKRQPTEWEKIFAHYTSGRGLTSRIYKELRKLTDSTTNKQPCEEMGKENDQAFLKTNKKTNRTLSSSG